MSGVAYANGIVYYLEWYDGVIHAFDPITGDILTEYEVPDPVFHNANTDYQPTGLTYDGQYFYMTTCHPNSIWKLSLDSPPDNDVTIISMTSLPSYPEEYGMSMDIAYANGYLYFPEYKEPGSIKKVDPSTGQIVEIFPSPADVIYAMTFDGDNLIAAFSVNDAPSNEFTGKFWVISPEDGSVQETWTAPFHGTFGLGYDQASDTLYIGLASEGILVAESLYNTPQGANVDVSFDETVLLTFPVVTGAGTTSLTTSDTGQALPSGFMLGDPPTYYELTTTATFSGSVVVCISYSTIDFTGDAEDLRLYHHDGAEWMDCTTSVDTANQLIYGSVESLSPFVIVEPDADGDGVADSVDSCPDTPSDALLVDSAGCSLFQYCPLDEEWRNHGQFVSCISHVAEQWLESGLITEDVKDIIVSEAAQSDVGKK